MVGYPVMPACEQSWRYLSQFTLPTLAWPFRLNAIYNREVEVARGQQQCAGSGYTGSATSVSDLEPDPDSGAF